MFLKICDIFYILEVIYFKSVKCPMPSFIFPDSTGVGQLILQFWRISGGEDFFGRDQRWHTF